MDEQVSLKRKPKISLRVKTFVALLIVGVPAVIVVLSTIYIGGTSIRQYYIGTRFQSLAQWMADEIKASFVAEISDAKSLALSPTLLKAVADANASYDKQAGQEAISAPGVQVEAGKEHAFGDCFQQLSTRPPSCAMTGANWAS